MPTINTANRESMWAAPVLSMGITRSGCFQDRKYVPPSTPISRSRAAYIAVPVKSRKIYTSPSTNHTVAPLPIPPLKKYINGNRQTLIRISITHTASPTFRYLHTSRNDRKATVVINISGSRTMGREPMQIPATTAVPDTAILSERIIRSSRSRKPIAPP